MQIFLSPWSLVVHKLQYSIFCKKACKICGRGSGSSSSKPGWLSLSNTKLLWRSNVSFPFKIQIIHPLRQKKRTMPLHKIGPLQKLLWFLIGTSASILCNSYNIFPNFHFIFLPIIFQNKSYFLKCIIIEQIIEQSVVTVQWKEDPIKEQLALQNIHR